LALTTVDYNASTHLQIKQCYIFVYTITVKPSFLRKAHIMSVT